MEDLKIIPVKQAVVGLGSPILRQVCPEAEQTRESAQVVLDLIETVNHLPLCVGLAAPQINVALQIFVMKNREEVEIVINPKITKRRMQQNYKEGCMSIPGVNEWVYNRDDILDVEYYDMNWKKVRKRLRGFNSIVFQHEYDHLQGILFIDRITQPEEVKEKLARIEKGEVATIYTMQWPRDGSNFYKTQNENEG